MSGHLQWYFLSWLIIGIAGQESPCPNIFRFENNGNQWHGIIRLPSSSFGTKIDLVVKISIGAQLPTSYVGKIELVGSDQYVAQQIQRGDIISYKVNFPLQNPVPKLTSVEINNRQYCSGPPETFSDNVEYVTSIQLDHSLSTIKYGASKDTQPINSFVDNSIRTQSPQIYQRPVTRPSIVEQYTYATQRPVYIEPTAPPTYPTQRPAYIEPIRQPTYEPNINTNVDAQQCGVPLKTALTNALIIGGETVELGEWPWLGALFSVKSANTKFVCSGSLISNTDIITAAHCVPRRKSESLIAKFGVLGVNDWGVNSKVAPVLKWHVHTNYDVKTKLSDIAILKIERIDFTEYIQPVCIWGLNNDLSYLVGRKGIVVGWGQDEAGNKVSPKLKKIDALISSTEECHRNDPRTIEFTSSKTICAGNRDGTGPCNGDSGGGLYFKLNRKWYIRGIISNSLSDIETGEPCGQREYVIYTDTGKYNDWINSIL